MPERRIGVVELAMSRIMPDNVCVKGE